jgi:hypothetical protein
MRPPIVSAVLAFDANGTPYSPKYGTSINITIPPMITMPNSWPFSAAQAVGNDDDRDDRERDHQ